MYATQGGNEACLCQIVLALELIWAVLFCFVF